jgi:hypothetical protein
VQHALAVARLHRVRVDVVGQRHHAPEPSGKALVDVHRGLRVAAGQMAGAFAGHRQHALLDLQVDARRIQARHECVDLQRARRAADVHRRKTAAAQAADARRQFESLLHVALQAVQFREQVAGKQGSVHRAVLHVGGIGHRSRAPGRAPTCPRRLI